MASTSLLLNPAQQTDATEQWIIERAANADVALLRYQSELGNSLWHLTFPEADVVEISNSHWISSPFVRILNQQFNWPVERIHTFIKQQGHLYELTLPDETTLYYACTSDASRSSLALWATEAEEE